MSRTVRTSVVFALLLAGYVGYVRLYATVARRLQPDMTHLKVPYDLTPSQSPGARESAELALKAFGEHHWTSGYNVTRYYNTDRGYWMYWGSVSFPEEHQRRRMVFAPFAIIWGSQRDGALKVMSGDRAVVDFDRPFELFKPGPKPNIARAKIEGIDEHVFIKDDKGTSDRSDDLLVMLPYAEYSESEMTITCDERVKLVDQDVEVTGRGLVIALRPGETSNGFPGAELITLSRDVMITSEDVGRTGLMPGAATNTQQMAAWDENGNGQPDGPPKTPARIMCDGRFTLRLPKPRIPARVGPPAPAQPTIAEFRRNVVIERGLDQPDRITGDHLTAIMVPKERPRPAEPPDPGAPDPEDQAVGGLRLFEARVDGHVVWIESVSQRFRGRGNELIYYKHDPDASDESHFKANPGARVHFERTEVAAADGPNRDAPPVVTSLLTIEAADATLFGDPENQGRSTIIARGPGLIEQRAGPGQPVERSATWRDQLVVETGLLDTTTESLDEHTYITLVGWPIVDDPRQLQMACRDEIVIALEPQPRSPAPAARAAPDEIAPPQGQSYRIDWVSARGDVHMLTSTGDPSATPKVAIDGTSTGVSGARRTLHAREKLDVLFEYPEAGATGNEPLAAAGRAPRDTGEARLIEMAAQDEPNREDVGPREPDPETDAEEPGLDVAADHVWARVEVLGDSAIGLDANAGPAREVREVRLRHEVRIHQDPPAGKEQGTDLTADAVDLFHPEPGALKLLAHGTEQPARVAGDDFDLSGPILGLDQKTDHAWVEGAGRLWQRTGRGGLGGIGALELPGDDEPEDDEPEEKLPLEITWSEGMDFYGIFEEDREEPGPARALFLGDVRAVMGDDGVNSCRTMVAIFDRRVDFDRAIPSAAEDPAGKRARTPRPKVDAVICKGDVQLYSLVRAEPSEANAESKPEVVEVRFARGDTVTFDKPSDHFWVDGEGTVLVTSADRLDLTSEPDGEDAPRNVRTIADRPSERRVLNQLRVDFNEGMKGRLGSARSGGYREATFSGDARALRAEVPSFQSVLDFDRLPDEFVRLDAREIAVEHNPALPGVPERNYLKAIGDPQARTDRATILGDRITYDSNTELFYVRGIENRVTITSQESLGQPLSIGNARAVVYNAKSGLWESINPGSAVFVRPDTGARARPLDPEPERKPREPQRPEPRLPPSNSLERQGFSGN